MGQHLANLIGHSVVNLHICLLNPTLAPNILYGHKSPEATPRQANLIPRKVWKFGKNCVSGWGSMNVVIPRTTKLKNGGKDKSDAM